MNYPFRNAVLSWLLGGDAGAFRETMEQQRENYPPAAFHSGMNALGTHDTVRILTLLGVGAIAPPRVRVAAEYRMTPEERQRGLQRLRLASLVQYAFPGSPTLYYGDEAGMEGFEDPFNRRPFPWGSEDRDLTAWYAALGRARQTLPPLRRGDIQYVRAEDGVLAFTPDLGGGRGALRRQRGRDPGPVGTPRRLGRSGRQGGLACPSGYRPGPH